MDYQRVLDEVRSDPEANLGRLKSVATSIDLSLWKAEFRKWRADGWVLQGRSEVVEAVAQDVSLDNSDPANGVVPTVQVDVCVDVSATDVVGPDGESVVASERADVTWKRLWVANYRYDEDPDDGWRVADSKSLEREPCAR